MPSVEPSSVQKVWLGWKASVPVILWDDLTNSGIRVAPHLEVLIYTYPTPILRVPREGWQSLLSERLF